MNTEHPITPSPELVTSLRNSAPHGIRDAGVTRELWLINHAYAAGADQELDAVEEEIIMQGWFANSVHRRAQLRAARRPKPPSLKEQALALVEQHEEGWRPSPKDWDTIRRALEALDD